MGLTLIIFNQLAIMLALAAAGWLLTKTGKVKDDQALAGLLTNAVLPALILHFLQVPYSPAVLRDIAITVAAFGVVFFVGMAVGLLLGKAARQTGQATGGWAVCIAAPNVIFMGWPIMRDIYGESAFPLAVGMILAFNVIIFLTSPFLFTMGEAGKGRVRVKELLLQPVILAAFVGILLFLTPFRLYGPAEGFVASLASLATPISMLMIGCQLARCSLRETFLDGRAYLVAIVRLTAAPIAGLLLIRPFISDPVIFGVVTIGSFMSVATIVAALAAQKNGDALFCARVIVISTVLSILTAPLLIPLLISL